MGKQGWNGAYFKGLDGFGKVSGDGRPSDMKLNGLSRRRSRTSRSRPASEGCVSGSLRRIEVSALKRSAVTLISAVLIVSLTFVEFVDYRRVHLQPSIVVDKSRGEKIVVDLNITFPRVPCYRANNRLLPADDEC